MEGYCVKCRAKKEIKDATASITEEIKALEQKIEATEDIDARGDLGPVGEHV